MIGSAENGYSFAYAPSIIKVGAGWHKYYCSSGTSNVAWDVIRYATSTDLINWTTPTQVIAPTDPVNERSCCDPSIVKFKGYYYLFYSGNKVDVQTVNFVARSTSPAGPFAKYTTRGTWEVNATDPKIIQYPFNANTEGSGAYGLGQPAVVVKGDVLYMWYTDTTEDPTAGQYVVYMSTSTDAVNWQRPIPTCVNAASIDVKYDAPNKRFVMFSGEEHHGSRPKMMSRVSDNGVHWSEPKALFDMPPYSHNVGVSGGEQGELQLDKMLFEYGAPPNLVDNISWASWDLYGQVHDTTTQAPVPFKRMVSAVASEAIPMFPASNVQDGNPTIYSSNPFPTNAITRPMFIATWFEHGRSNISKVMIKARMNAGVPMCFPARYRVHVTAPDNSAWILVGEVTTQPAADGWASIDVGPRESYGIMIVPRIATPDSNGNHYVQFAEISAQ